MQWLEEVFKVLAPSQLPSVPTLMNGICPSGGCYVCRYYVHTSGRRKEKGAYRKFDSVYPSAPVTLSAPLIGQNCVTWPPIAARESGEEHFVACAVQTFPVMLTHLH